MKNEKEKNPISSIKEEAPQPSAETTPVEETEQAKTKKEKRNRRTFKEVAGSEKFRRGSMSTAFTAGFIVVVVLINIIVGLLVERYPSVNVDLTKNHTNTLSTQAASVVDKVKDPTTIYIIATESQTKSDRLLSSYGIQYSQVGELAAKMAERNRNIKVEYIDLDKNPTFASDYKTDNLTTGDVVIKTEKRSRVLTVNDLFNVSYGEDGSITGSSSMVDSALASGLNSVVANTISVAAFDTGHSEQMDSTTYKKLLSNNSFETKDFSLLTDAIPTAARLVVLGCPATDYTDTEIKKLDAFLSSSAIAGDRSLLITFHPSQTSMPKLSAFLKEWGISVTPQTIVVENDSTKYYTSDPSFIFSNVQSTLNLGANSDYKLYTTPQSSPVNLLFDTKGTKKTYSLSKSNDTCYLVNNKTKEDDNPVKASYDTEALSQDTVKAGGKEYKANVIALGSTTMFNAEILSTNTFSNAKYLVDLSRYATGTTNAATAITEVPVQTNVQDITLSTGMSILLGFGVFTVLIPLAIVVAGICVYRRRRNL